MEVRLWRRTATLPMTVVAATHRHHQFSRLFLELSQDGVTGYGEVSPLTHPIVPDPGFDSVVRHAVETAVPRLRGYVTREGRLPEWSRMHLWSGGTPESSWTSSLLEMALLDWSLSRDRQSFGDESETQNPDVLTLATTSLIEPDESWRPPAAAARVRAKVNAHTDPVWAVEIAAQWNLPVLWDFNGGARDEGVVHALALAIADRVETVAIEQPFAAGDLAAHSLLARDLDVPLSLDESVTSPARVRLIARHGAASLICVKPARVGGLAAARATMAEARAHGLRVYVGGFFESPLARRTHATVARSESAEPSDVAPVAVREDRADLSREVGLGTVPFLDNATLLYAWENN